MKLLIIAAFVANICYVNAGKTAKLLAAMNAGLLNGPGLAGGLNGAGLVGGLNGIGLVGGVNPGLVGGLNSGLVGGLNPGLVNRAIPGMVAGGLNPGMLVAGGGAGFVGQPQFAQFVPGVPAYAVQGPIPNVYNVPAVNPQFPLMGVPQMAPVNPPQQPGMGVPVAAAQQQLPQADPLRRFRRHIMRQDNTLKTTVDTQIPAPTETMTATGCDKEAQQEN